MYHEVLVRILHGVAHRRDQSQPGVDVESVLIAIAVDRRAVDVLHGEVRELVVGDATVEKPSDARVRERGEDLPLVEESADGLGGLQAARQHLERDALTKLPIVSLGEVHHTHAAVSRFSRHDVRADASSRWHGTLGGPLAGEHRG